jgi:hypothetical protein
MADATAGAAVPGIVLEIEPVVDDPVAVVVESVAGLG